MANWSKKKYTRAERKHLAENGITSVAVMRATREHQRSLSPSRIAAGLSSEICHDCAMIARKMGLD